MCVCKCRFQIPNVFHCVAFRNNTASNVRNDGANVSLNFPHYRIFDVDILVFNVSVGLHITNTIVCSEWRRIRLWVGFYRKNNELFVMNCIQFCLYFVVFWNFIKIVRSPYNVCMSNGFWPRCMLTEAMVSGVVNSQIENIVWKILKKYSKINRWILIYSNRPLLFI